MYDSTEPSKRRFRMEESKKKTSRWISQPSTCLPHSNCNLAITSRNTQNHGNDSEESPDFLRLDEFLDMVDVVLFDCDGVLWSGQTVIDGAPTVLQMLTKTKKKRVFYITNNSTSCREKVLEKMLSIGLVEKGLDDDTRQLIYSSIVTSGYAAALHLVKDPDFAPPKQRPTQTARKRVYVIGEQGLINELRLAGIDCFGGPEDNGKVVDPGSGLRDIEIDENVGAVVIGLDRGFNYYKLQYAQLCINNLGAKFIATNEDPIGPFTKSQMWAGTGAIVGALRGCCHGVEPVHLGKPSMQMIDLIEGQIGGVARDRMAMVGDRLSTDIKFGNDAGMWSVLALSGVTCLEDLKKQEDESMRPHLIIQSVKDLLPEQSEE